MSNEKKKSFRQKIQENAALIASIIAILAAITSFLTWVSGYFATQAQLKEAKCIAEINASIMSRQIEQIILGDEYLEKNKVMVELENKKRKNPESFNNDNECDLRRLQSDAESILKRKEDAVVEVKRLIEVLKSGEVLTSSGECKSFKGD